MLALLCAAVFAAESPRRVAWVVAPSNAGPLDAEATRRVGEHLWLEGHDVSEAAGPLTVAEFWVAFDAATSTLSPQDELLI